MCRESINITVSASLRKERLRQRLAAMSEETGINPTQIAGRALLLGLELIEKDPCNLFPRRRSRTK